MLFITALALILASYHCASAILPRETPDGWMSDYLEEYEHYYARYLALSCDAKQGSDFFDQCCHPLMTAENLSERPAECDPDHGDDLPYCNEDGTSAVNLTDVPITEKLDPETTSPEFTARTDMVEPSRKRFTAVKKATFSSNNVSATVNYGGFATFYYQNGVAGACGTVYSDNDYIAALDGERYGNVDQQSSFCGMRVQLTNTNNLKTVIVTIVDACPTCMNRNSIDLSVAAFNGIATLTEGMVPIVWSYL